MSKNKIYIQSTGLLYDILLIKVLIAVKWNILSVVIKNYDVSYFEYNLLSVNQLHWWYGCLYALIIWISDCRNERRVRKDETQTLGNEHDDCPQNGVKSNGHKIPQTNQERNQRCDEALHRLVWPHRILDRHLVFPTSPYCDFEVWFNKFPIEYMS